MESNASAHQWKRAITERGEEIPAAAIDISWIYRALGWENNR